MTKRDVVKAGRLTATRSGTDETYTILRVPGSVRWHAHQHGMGNSSGREDGWVGSFHSLNAAVAWLERNTGRHFAQV